MEIKATLQKPYTQEDKNEFVSYYNYQLNYQIVDTTESLQAWGYGFCKVAFISIIPPYTIALYTFDSLRALYISIFL